MDKRSSSDLHVDCTWSVLLERDACLWPAGLAVGTVALRTAGDSKVVESRHRCSARLAWWLGANPAPVSDAGAWATCWAPSLAGTAVLVEQLRG